MLTLFSSSTPAADTIPNVLDENKKVEVSKLAKLDENQIRRVLDTLSDMQKRQLTKSLLSAQCSEDQQYAAKATAIRKMLPSSPPVTPVHGTPGIGKKV